MGMKGENILRCREDKCVRAGACECVCMYV